MSDLQSTNQCIDSLIKQGNLKRLDIKILDAHLQKQMTNLNLLHEKSEIPNTSPSKQFLFKYDALFRLLEITLIKHWGVCLDERPHQSFKHLIFVLFPDLNTIASTAQIKQLVQLRHKIKKEGHSTSQEMFNLMCAIYQYCLTKSQLLPSTPYTG